MTETSFGFEIVEHPTHDDSLQLELFVEGARVARASASADTLSDMKVSLAMGRDAVAASLREALLAALSSQGQKVEVTDVVEDPTQPLRFFARYAHRLRDEIATGLVWYDLSASTTGPEMVTAVVRNKMRFEVHRKLTEPGSAARALVDIHE